MLWFKIVLQKVYTISKIRNFMCIGIVKIKGNEAREVIYTSSYTSGHLIPTSVMVILLTGFI